MNTIVNILSPYPNSIPARPIPSHHFHLKSVILILIVIVIVIKDGDGDADAVGRLGLGEGVGGAPAQPGLINPRCAHIRR